MDAEQLINEIFVRPALWDNENKYHHNRFILDKLWDEVAGKLNSTRFTVRMKWKALRDKFRITLASIPKPKAGDDGTGYQYITWQYFESLQFLKNQFAARRSPANFKKCIQSPQIVQKMYEDQDSSVQDSERRPVSCASLSGSVLITPCSSSIPQPILSLEENIRRSKKRCATDDKAHEFLLVEKEKRKYLDTQKRKNLIEENEDLNFFKSLLPHLKHFTSCEKITYRMKMLELTQEYVQRNIHISSTKQSKSTIQY